MTPLFLLSIGRSGSTLLQRLFNVHPAAFIYGEHNGLLRPLCATVRLLQVDGQVSVKHGRMIREKMDTSSTFIAWARPFDRAEYVQSLRTLLPSLYKVDSLPRGAVWGFKEIRYDAGVA